MSWESTEYDTATVPRERLLACLCCQLPEKLPTNCGWAKQSLHLWSLDSFHRFCLFHFKDILLLLYSRWYQQCKLTFPGFTSLGLDIPKKIFFSYGHTEILAIQKIIRKELAQGDKGKMEDKRRNERVLLLWSTSSNSCFPTLICFVSLGLTC